jgi:hypothetical protein
MLDRIVYSRFARTDTTKNRLLLLLLLSSLRMSIYIILYTFLQEKIQYSTQTIISRLSPMISLVRSRSVNILSSHSRHSNTNSSSFNDIHCQHKNILIRSVSFPFLFYSFLFLIKNETACVDTYRQINQ